MFQIVIELICFFLGGEGVLGTNPIKKTSFCSRPKKKTKWVQWQFETFRFFQRHVKTSKSYFLEKKFCVHQHGGSILWGTLSLESEFFTQTLKKPFRNCFTLLQTLKLKKNTLQNIIFENFLFLYINVEGSFGRVWRTDSLVLPSTLSEIHLMTLWYFGTHYIWSRT